MKLAITGKGGVGKTTISGILSRTFGKNGKEVLAIDGDPNPNLSMVLGLGREPVLPPALSSSVLERKETADGKKYIELGVPLEEVIRDYGLKASDGVTLLNVGQPEHAGTGCMCGSHTTVREIVHAALKESEQVTVLDMEASLEHMKRGTSKYVDALFTVVEPYFRSLEAASRFHRLAKELGVKRVGAIANKVRTEEERSAIEQYCRQINLPLELIIPYDPEIEAADKAGVSVMDKAPDSLAVKTIRQWVEEELMPQEESKV